MSHCRYQHHLCYLLSLLLLLCISGCASSRYGKSSAGGDGEVRLSSLLPTPPKQVERRIEFEKLADAIERAVGSRGVRIVRVFRRNAARGIPEHRVFDVRKGGPFYLLGVRSGDILLGINDRLIPEPQVMNAYPQAVLQDGTSSLTLNRADELFQLDIVVTGDTSGMKKRGS